MSSTGRLFLHMGIFAGITFLVYLSCLWMIRIEERRQARRAKR